MSLSVNDKIETPEQLIELCGGVSSVTVTTDEGAWLARWWREDAEPVIGMVGVGADGKREERPIREGIEWCGANPRVAAIFGMYRIYRDVAKRDAESHRVGEEATRFYNADD